MDLEQALAQTIPGIDAASRIYIAYSGGLDSQVLLHLAADFVRGKPYELIALHLNHGLSENAAQWQNFCARQCERLGISYLSRSVELDPLATGSLEQHARNARYDWFETLVGPRDVLLTAHHQNDQAETLVLRLLRASGTHGLAAIPQSRSLGDGQLIRPLLGISRASLQSYADQRGLSWVEDESNHDLSFDRNYIRHQLMPVLQQRWPDAARQFARSAQHCRDDQALLDELAAIDLESVASKTAEFRLTVAPVLSLARFRCLSPARQRHLMQTLLRRLSGHRLPDTQLREWLRQCATVQAGANPSMALQGLRLAVYEQRMYFLQSIPEMSGMQYQCLPGHGVNISELNMTLDIRELDAPADRVYIENCIEIGSGEHLRVHWRKGGERVRLSAASGSKSLKKLLQEKRVPPWLRDALPLVSYQGRIIWSAALGDLCPGIVDAQRRPLRLSLCENKSNC